MINCEFFLKEKNKKCSLGLYGGNPTSETCLKCIGNKQNNKRFAEEIFSKYKISHPQSVERINGCCDSAINYIE